ncbi:hypothetical protein LCGC14_0468830 [marine sediment metagenome]|uniref:Uncharacterized protein n=1 Tax=marine sediment metagenome TaxID=412755 RepID=A0A0F9SVN1_9ZZZZ
MNGPYWLRLGDQSDYEAYFELHELLNELEDVDQAYGDKGIGQVTEWRDLGFETTEFRGNNYISLYVGEDDKPDPVRDLDDHERRQVEQTLDRGDRSAATEANTMKRTAQDQPAEWPVYSDEKRSRNPASRKRL